MTTILNASSSSGLVATADTSGILQLQTANTAAMTIDASQNVGIGTASPASYGKLASVGTNTSAALLNVRDEGTPTGNLVSISANSLGTALAVNSAGNTRVLNLGLGGTTPSTSGTGITFPATQSASSDANTLDDYEEGTWTCSVYGELVTGTPATATGYYTKIGNIVNVFAKVENFAKPASATGNVNIGGLPFSISSTSTTYSRGGIGLLFLQGGTSIAGSNWSLRDLSNGGTVLRIQYQTNINSDANNLDISNFGATGNYLRFAFTYQV